MKFLHIAFLFFYILAFVSCKNEYVTRNFNSVKIEEISMNNTSIRAIHALPDSTLYYADSNGNIGLLLATNEQILQEKIVYDTIIPHFRSIASNGNEIYALSIGNPALLYQLSEGEINLVYKEEDPKVFYDAMDFFDDRHGIAMGDPTDSCLSILLTNDGGQTWNKLECIALPIIQEGEAAFAASNSNIAIIGTNAWVVTGGKRARVFYTPDMGASWDVYNTPITEGGQMTGIYSIDFFDEKNGIIFGGDWNNKTNNIANKAITDDGGKTWKLVADGKEPGYKSCVQYVPDTQGKEVFAVGTNGISYSNDQGETWRKVSDDAYYTIRFVNKNFAWLAGEEKIGKMILN